MNIGERLNRNGDKMNFYYDFGRGPGQRPSTGVWVYNHPRSQTEKNHNKQALALLEIKKSQMTIDEQSTGSGFIPAHKFKTNFLDYYQQYLDANRRRDNRHLQGSLNHFKAFIKKDIISPVDVTENLCTRFRQYLLDRFKGDTPANYFARFKRVLRAATKDGYYRLSPCEEVAAKKNPSPFLKENLSDLVGYNLWPTEIIAEIRCRGIGTIAGIHDAKVQNLTVKKMDEFEKNYSYKIITEENKKYLSALPAHILHYLFTGPLSPFF